MSTVWVPHKVKDDISPAELYGRLEYVNSRYIYGDEIQQERLPTGFVWNIQGAVDKFNPRTDYLLLAGDWLQIAALAARLEQTHGCFRVLRWDRIAKGYISIWLGSRVPTLTEAVAAE